MWSLAEHALMEAFNGRKHKSASLRQQVRSGIWSNKSSNSNDSIRQGSHRHVLVDRLRWLCRSEHLKTL